MKRFPIFRTGKHTAMSGATLDFSEAQLKAAVAAYDPALHEAPITVGHPKDNLPAYGWIGALHFSEETGEIEVDPTQVDPAFAELVEAGRFKKRSASWYLPDAPNNPKPGTLYLRHVAFLGAQPPAVKGLRDVSFSDAETGVVEFGDSARWAWGSVAAIMRGLREWLIGDKGLETADKLVPNFYLSDLEAAAKAADEPTPAALPAFSEGNTMPTTAELQAQIATLTAENAALKANQKPADFAERETSIATREAAVRAAEDKIARAEIERRIDAAVADGRMLKTQRDQAVNFAASLPAAEQTLDFAEGDKTEKVSPREHYLRQVEKAAKVIEFGELSGQTGDNGGGRPSLEETQQALRKQVAGGGATK